MRVLRYMGECLATLVLTFVWVWPWFKWKVGDTRRRMREKILTVRFVRGEQTIKTELRFLGIKIGRATYCRIGRLLGRKKDGWRDPDGDIRRF